jgi:hypothetical protein
MMFTRAEWYGSWPHWSEVNYDSTLKDVESAQYPEDSDKRFNERLAIIFYKYRDILDASYHLLLSESNDLEKLIQLAPGLLVIEPFTPVPDIVRLLNINEASFLDLLERNRHFLNFLKPKNRPYLELVVNLHLREFLADRSRSRGHYYDPVPHHLAICLNEYKLTFDNDHPWSDANSM